MSFTPSHNTMFVGELRKPTARQYSTRKQSSTGRFLCEWEFEMGL